MLGTLVDMAAPSHADELAAACLENAKLGRGYSLECIRRLCEMATSADSEEARCGTDAIFAGIVEPLADRFEPRLCDEYLRFFSQVIDYCRRQPAGQALDRKLRDFGLGSQEKLIERATRLRRIPDFSTEEAARLQKILVLSRVTLGADIAVTSVVLSKMKELAERAQIVLLGSAKSASFFAGDERIEPLLVNYRRGGTLIERLNAWVALADTVNDILEGLADDAYVIVDPDSRLTQLGLLPLTQNDRRYYFFESRAFTCPGASALPELTSCWLNRVFGGDGKPVYPYVCLAREDLEAGSAVRHAGKGALVSVNFGAGDKSAKRIGDRFECDLIQRLVKQGYRVVLDRGAGAEELARAGRLENKLRQEGLTVRPIDPKSPAPAEVMTWEGSLSTFAGIIETSDLYIGYDSAGGHLAAALRAPCLTIFAGAPCKRMIERWRPWGPARTGVVAVEPGDEPAEVLERVQEYLP